MKNIADIRTEYSKKSLEVSDVLPDPLAQFTLWFDEVLTSEVLEPNAMSLATVKADGKPANRIVLLKGIEEGGFVFYTNYNSHKGQELLRNPQASLTFLWAELERQVRIEGTVEKVRPELSDEYFNSRPRSSQIGAWVSPQSQIIESRQQLEKIYVELEQKFEGKTVERPPHWGGFVLRPEAIEFWQGRPSRLHDRIRYSKEEDNWKIARLAP